MGAAEHAQRVGLRAPMLNHLNFGGYLGWKLREPVFIDGRLEVVGESFFRRYRDALGSEEALEATVDRYGIGWLVFPHATSPRLLDRVSNDPRWRLAHVDAVSATFVREGPTAAAAVDVTSLREPSRVTIEQVRTLPGLGERPRSSALWRALAGLRRKQVFPSEDHARGLFHFYRGELEAAGTRFASAIRECDGAYFELYANLAAVLVRQGHADVARRCYEIVLDDDPGNAIALRKLSELGAASPEPAR
jgi:tetratricopeptide (TPR) repeat protein